MLHLRNVDFKGLSNFHTAGQRWKERMRNERRSKRKERNLQIIRLYKLLLTELFQSIQSSCYETPEILIVAKFRPSSSSRLFANFPLTDTLSRRTRGGEGFCFSLGRVNDNRHQTVADAWPSQMWKTTGNSAEFQAIAGVTEKI